jgi:hypothetical protein
VGRRASVAPSYEDLLGSRTKLVALSHASNVLGTVPPVKELTALAHRYDARVLIDGAQRVAHFPVDVTDLDAGFYAFSGHELFAPAGIGVLYGRAELMEHMAPWQGGGNMIGRVDFDHTTYAAPPHRFEAGTGHIAGAIGLRGGAGLRRHRRPRRDRRLGGLAHRLRDGRAGRDTGHHPARDDARPDRRPRLPVRPRQPRADRLRARHGGHSGARRTSLRPTDRHCATSGPRAPPARRCRCTTAARFRGASRGLDRRCVTTRPM